MRDKLIRILVFACLLWTVTSSLAVPVFAEEGDTIYGGITVLKTDAFGNPLSGSVFQIAREATRKELTDSSVTKRLLRVGGGLMTVVYDSFWNTKEMYGGKQTEAVTAENGIAAIYGLPYGTYYLVESRSPEGYAPMPEPLRITINKYSHLTPEDNIRDDENTVIDNTVHIITLRHSLSDTKFRSPMCTVAAVSVVCFLLAVILLSRLRRCHKL